MSMVVKSNYFIYFYHKITTIFSFNIFKFIFFIFFIKRIIQRNANWFYIFLCFSGYTTFFNFIFILSGNSFLPKVPISFWHIMKKKLASINTVRTISGIIRFWLNICFKTGATDFIVNSKEILYSSTIYILLSFIAEVRSPSLKITWESLIVVAP